MSKKILRKAQATKEDHVLNAEQGMPGRDAMKTSCP